MRAVGEPAAKVHLAYLDGLRGAAALYVVAHHIFSRIWDYFGAGELPRVGGAALLWLVHGRYAVDLFIVLSGYCLMLPVLRDGLAVRGGALGYYWRRAWRILPAYYAALALSLALDWALIGRPTGGRWDVCLPVDRQSIASCLLMLQDAWRRHRINHVFWSIAVEWRIYFLLPPLVWAWRRAGPGPTSALVAGAVVVATPFARRLGIEPASVQVLALFVFGMLAATVAAAGSMPAALALGRVPWGVGSAAMVALVGLACTGPRAADPSWRWGRQDLFVGAVWAVVLVYLATARGAWLARVASIRPLVYCGAIGYSLYLIHAPLIEVLHQYCFAPLGLGKYPTFGLHVAVGIPAIVLASSGFARLFERRARVVEVARAD